MSFRVNLEDSDDGFITRETFRPAAVSVGPVTSARPKRRVFLVVAVAFGTVALVSILAGYFYYQGLKRTPQYSLALLVDAAKRDDQTAIEQLIDINAVVDD